MKKISIDLIKKVAKKIDIEKYNVLLLSHNYDKYLEGILTILVKGILDLENLP